MKIGKVDTRQRVLVVAEIGNNHEGDFERARGLVRAAARAGADAVKFQTLRAAELVPPADRARFERLRGFELSGEQFTQLAAEARRAGVMFLSTPFDLESVELLDPLVPAFKIASGDNDFYPLIDRVATTGKPILISAGLSTLDEIRYSVARIRHTWRSLDLDPDLALLHCVSSYPTPPEQAGLRCISTLANALCVTPGYSDHTLGIDACVLAVAAGARVIEKHFTLDKNQSDFRDHQLSADPPEFAEMVRRIRAAELMLGDGRCEPQAAELEALTSLRRFVVARGDLPAGHVLGWRDLAWVRGTGGLRPGREHLLLGRPLARAVAAGTPIRVTDVAGDETPSCQPAEPRFVCVES